MLYAGLHQRIESTTFNEGDPIGFTRREGGLEAVAGDDRIRLMEGDYSWVVEPTLTPTQLHRVAHYSPPQIEPQWGQRAVSEVLNAGLGWLRAGAPDSR